MTDQTQAIAWYRQQAEWFGDQARIWIQWCEPVAAEHARLAGHFAGLVIGFESLAKDGGLVVLRYRTAPPEADTDPTGSVKVGR